MHSPYQTDEEEEEKSKGVRRTSVQEGEVCNPTLVIPLQKHQKYKMGPNCTATKITFIITKEIFSHFTLPFSISGNRLAQ